MARGVETLLIVAVFGVLGTLVAQASVATVRKAWMSEVALSVRGLQIDSVEHFALSGRWLETGTQSAQNEVDGSGQARRSEAEELGIEFRRAPTPAASELAEKVRPSSVNGSISSGRVAAVRLGVVNGTLVAVGRFGERGDAFSWALRPAVLAAPPPMVVVWLCGARQPGPRWQAAPPLDWSDLRAEGWCRAEGLQ